MYSKFFLFLFLIFLSSSFVLSLGVAPARTQIDFEPNLKTNFVMSIINNPLIDREVEIYVNLFELDENIREEFRDIVSLENTRISFTKEETVKTLIISLNLPEGFSQGGTHKLRIGARPPLDPSGEGLAVVAGNELDVLINVPEVYVNQKYAIIKEIKILGVTGDSVSPGEDSEINVLIKSESGVILNGVYAEIKVLKDGKVMRTFKTDRINIAPGEEKTFKEIFSTGIIPSGNLVLEAEVFYGSDSVKSVGSLNIIGNTGLDIGKSSYKFSWFWFLIIIIIITILLVVSLLLFFLLRRKKNEQGTQLVGQQMVANQ